MRRRAASTDPWWEWIWPSLTTTASAGYAVKQGFWAAVTCAAAVAGVVAFNAFVQSDSRPPFGVGALLDAVAFAAIAVGLSRQSRTAAVCGLALYATEQLYAWGQSRPLSPGVVLIFVLAFANAVRGAFALRHLAAGHDSDRAP